MKLILAFLALTGVAFGQFSPAKDDLSNVDPATGRAALDVPATGEAATTAQGELADNLAVAPLAVADAAARKLASTYVTAEVTPVNGLRVIQDDLPDVVWTLLDVSDITSDANWYGGPRTDADGALPLSGVITGYDIKTIQVITTARSANRVATVKCVGAITSGTYLTVTVTGPPANSGSPKAINVTVAAGDDVAEWLPKIVTALNADADFSPHYTFYEGPGIIQMQEVVKTAADVFSCNIAVGDTAGVTANNSAQTLQNAFINCGRATLPASLVASDQKFIISGNVNVRVDSPNTAASNNYLSLALVGTHSGTLGPTVFTPYVILQTEASNGGCASAITLAAPAILKQSGGLFGLSMTGANTIANTYGGIEFARNRSTNVATVSPPLQWAGATTIYNQSSSKDCVVQLTLIFPIDTAATGGFVLTDLRITPVDSWN